MKTLMSEVEATFKSGAVEIESTKKIPSFLDASINVLVDLLEINKHRSKIIKVDKYLKDVSNDIEGICKNYSSDDIEEELGQEIEELENQLLDLKRKHIQSVFSDEIVEGKQQEQTNKRLKTVPYHLTCLKEVAMKDVVSGLHLILL